MSVHNYVQKSGKQDVRAQLRDAAAGLSPWDTIPPDRLAAIGRRCGPAEIAQIIAAIDDFSAERAALPGWDGDSHADIGRAQETYMAILSHVREHYRDAAAAGLKSASPDTRRWVTLALERIGPATLPALRAARDTEADVETRAFMTEAIGRLEADRGFSRD